MNYALAKKLKDAGFPQRGRGIFLHDVEVTQRNEDGLGTHLWYDEKNDVYAPTLSELIEACGDKFGTLTAKTPEEAVARLWLALTPVSKNHE